MSQLTVGVLAHVDAGKTTLSESILYQCGAIRSLGRVDNQDAFLDNFLLERARGITIFSKQAKVRIHDIDVTLLDTPGHIDFSPDMERTLQVLDYAILVISGLDGVQGHTTTLWRLLEKHHIPAFLFVNKMDISLRSKENLLQEIQQRLSENIVDFSNDGESPFFEFVAMCHEDMLGEFLEKEMLTKDTIRKYIKSRNVFPCFFGSALKLQGVEELLKGIELYAKIPDYRKEFGAKIFKIARDAQGNRLTYLKVTGARLKVKDLLTNGMTEIGKEKWEEKVNQIRIYSGTKYETKEEVEAGTVCTVTGLSKTYPGEGLGIEAQGKEPAMEPVLSYTVYLPQEINVVKGLGDFRVLEEEQPELHVIWDEKMGEIHIQVMGEVQVEILKSMIQERFGYEVHFGPGGILYRETIENTVVGVGHFEPLRHYAEVHLLLEPGEQGSGISCSTDCSEDILDKNWQRLIMTHLLEKEHIGVLTGSPITDIKITLINGKAHEKHTEGGDFRQATYRALRQGLKKAKSIILEPYYHFQIEIPSKYVGRAMTDIENRKGQFETPITKGEETILKGTAPVKTMEDYQQEVISYTKGKGRIFYQPGEYEKCHNEEEVIEKIAYESERDLNNPTGSIFCSHGAGYNVPWNEVEEHMHLHDFLGSNKEETISEKEERRMVAANYVIDEEEIAQIFERTYGANKGEKKQPYHKLFQKTETMAGGGKKKKSDEKYLIVDGYNIIFAWKELKELASDNIDSARDKLMDILSNYQGYTGERLILVFDAYKVKGNIGEKVIFHNIEVVYTKEDETADMYIERLTNTLGSKYQVTVATSDGLVQLITRGQDCSILSANGLLRRVCEIEKEIREDYL